MHPQTDAEIIAWNYGAVIATAPPARHDIVSAVAGAMLYPIGDAARTALDTLGPELFWTWADRGYYSHHTTSQQ